MTRPADNKHHARIDVENTGAGGTTTTGDIAGGNITKSLSLTFGIGAAIVLALGLIVAFAGPDFTQIGLELRITPTSEPAPNPKSTPTPRAFDPGKQHESLIIVAQFDDRSAGKHEGVDPDQYIYDQLRTQVQRDGFDIRVEHLPDVLDDSTARRTGEVYSATLVLWGWYDKLSVTPRLERIKGEQRVITDEESQALSIADPQRIEFSVVDDLPTLSSYLVLVTLGADRYAESEYDNAHSYLTSAIEAVPQDEPELTTKPDEAYFLRGLINYDTEAYDQATADYTQAITFEYELLSWAYNNRGASYANLGEYTQAIADFDQVIKLDSQDADAYSNRGVVYYLQKEYMRAIADFDQAIELDPQNTDAYSNRGVVYKNLEQHAKAIADFDKAIVFEPQNAGAYYNRGNAYLVQGDYKRAIADYDQAITLNPKYADTYYNRGSAYAEQGEYAKAIDDYTEYIRLVPDAPNGWSRRGYLYIQIERYQRAVADFDKAIVLDNDYAYCLRGNAYTQLADYPQAMDDFTDCSNRIPNDPSAWNQICWWGTLTGAAADVVDACEQAVQLAPDRGSIRDSRGLNRALNGDAQGAIEDFKAFIVWAQQLEVKNGDMAQLISKREAWVAALEAGENPFDTATLEALRNE